MSFGFFCWHDLYTADLDTAKSFYGDLLGRDLTVGRHAVEPLRGPLADSSVRREVIDEQRGDEVADPCVRLRFFVEKPGDDGTR